MWKDANSLPPLAPLCPSHRDPQTEGLCFAERNTVCAAEPHLSLCQSALCICSAGARFASARQFFKRKALAFPISVRICFSKSARQAEQTHSHQYWAWTWTLKKCHFTKPFVTNYNIYHETRNAKYGETCVRVTLLWALVKLLLTHNSLQRNFHSKYIVKWTLSKLSEKPVFQHINGRAEGTMSSGPQDACALWDNWQQQSHGKWPY